MKTTMKQLLQYLLVAASSLAISAHAQMRIDVVGIGANQIPIAIAPLANEASLPVNITEIVRADLQRSGVFRIVDASSTKADENSAVVFADWRAKGADVFVAGSVAKLADGRFDLRMRIYDNAKQVSIGGFSNTPVVAQLRLAAHRIADQIFEKLTGDKGMFSTRIAYVLKRGSQFTLQIADADGYGPQAALTSNESIISPSWSPDGNHLAYVSFEQRKPIVFVHSISTGQRRQVAAFKGSNSAPAWSPDGSKLAVTLTTSGQSQLYLINADGTGQPKRLATSSGIDTEPFFSPDAKFIYFTSDRGGGPQIYRMPASGGDAERVTFKGDYNVTPRVSPDGKLLSYVARRSGRFQIAVQDLSAGTETILNDTAADESPSFAPNNRYLLYATAVDGREVLGMVSTDGRIHNTLTVPTGDVREPTWGPYQ
jgi:TolB protein